MDSGQLPMDNGQWTMDNGQWTMDNANGQWTVDNVQCTMENQWTVANRQWSAVMSSSPFPCVFIGHWQLVIGHDNTRIDPLAMTTRGLTQWP
jgi:hypothetical protein